MGEILVQQLMQAPTEEQDVELVERKGLGHPDSICDAIANHASVALCQEYKKAFGRILHHNLDKALLVAGSSSPRIGGGTIEKPMRLVLGDRATAEYMGKSIDVQGIVIEAARDWMRLHLRFVDPDRHVIFQSEIKAGSAQLMDLFDRDARGANDTSAAVGFAPLTRTEQLVLSLERYMNSPEFKRLFPETGEDIKVMACRNKRTLHLTIAVAFVDRFIRDAQAYFERKGEIAENLWRFLNAFQHGFERILVDINILDDPRRAEDGMYLTVIGTSAEEGDSGQIGRGNRANGLISINRPQSIEAHAGKNPVNHVGKIYSYFAHHVARQIYSRLNGLQEVYVHLCSHIGRPIEDPAMSSVKMILKPGLSSNDAKHAAESILSEELARVNEFALLLATDNFYDSWEESLKRADV